MLITEPIRERIEDIILGIYQIPVTKYQFNEGLFQLSNPDIGTIEEQNANASERKIEVLAGPIKTILPLNHADDFGMYYSDFTVKVSYFYTHLGGDLEEVLISNSGSGYLKQINDRANEDAFNIGKTLTYYEAFSGVTPAVYKVDDPDFSMSIEGQKVIAELTFRVEFQYSL